MPATEFINIRVTDNKINQVTHQIVEQYQQQVQNQEQNNENNSYEVSYGYLVNYARSIKNNNKFADQGLIVLAHAVYGWMPTILTIHHGINNQQNIDLSDIREILQKICRNPETNNFLDEAEDLRKIAKFTNKSFVGASKFLHFLFPELFAIWDSNINSVLQIRRTTANNVNAFVIYQKAMRAARQQHFPNTSLRDIEKRLFDIGRRNGYHNDN